MMRTRGCRQLATGILLSSLLASCGRPVSDDVARAACEADQRVQASLKADEVLNGRVGNVQSSRGGIAPEYDASARQCATNFVTITWAPLTIAPDRAVEALVSRLLAAGWVETTGSAVASPSACPALPSSACPSTGGLLRGLSKTIGEDRIALRVEFDTATRSLEAKGRLSPA